MPVVKWQKRKAFLLYYFTDSAQYIQKHWTVDLLMRNQQLLHVSCAVIRQ